MARPIKLTNNRSDRKDQRQRTNNLIKATKQLPPLQKTAPRYLKGTARTAWSRIVPQLQKTDYIKTADKSIVEALCVQIAIYREAYNEVVKDGIQQAIYRAIQDNKGDIIENEFVGFRKNPAVQTLDSATAKIKSLSDALGMTPTSRAQLLNVTDDKQDAPSMEEMRKAFGAQ